MVQTVAGKPWRRFAVVLVLLLAVAGILEAPLLTFYRISGNSMLPSFTDGDRVLVTTFSDVDVGDAVIARFAGETLIKRVVAGPGDTIEVFCGTLIRNGHLANGVAPGAYRDRSCEPPRRLGPEEYFLLGDNRRVSVDSRSFGPVTSDDIVGKVIYRWFDAHRATPVTAAERR